MVDLYPLLRPLLFRLSPERAHEETLRLLDTFAFAAGALYPSPGPAQPVRAMGLTFPNVVGLAAGMDKNGAHVDALGALGFGHIEVGTVTPRPQPGNPKPRLFRLPAQQGLINRMGFNNDGMDALVENLRGRRYSGVLGISIGKNFDTPNERAVEDYVACMGKVYAQADYIAVNISSPNTKDLRSLQDESNLVQLVSRLKEEQAALQTAHGKYVPLAVKLSPDLADDVIAPTAETLAALGVDGIIATNTTVTRPGMAGPTETGGLSGAPVRDRATEVIRRLREAVGERVPIIGVGGILSGVDACEKLKAGAVLVQVYTGLVYRGPALIGEVARSACSQQATCKPDML